MKRKNAWLWVLVSLLLLATGCQKKAEADTATKEDAKTGLKIVTTIFPEYDWTRQILGDQLSEVELDLLADNRDLHSYQPTVKDMEKIATADLFIYVGGESDAWVSDALKKNPNDKRIVLSLMELLSGEVKEEEHVEGMEEEDHDHEDGQSHEEEEEEVEYDEHVWLSVRKAAKVVDHIKDALKKLDESHSAVYEANARAYKESLSALDADFKAVVEQGETKTILFADRFPFRYLVEDYGLSYYAAFAGCSAETGASFDTIAFLAGKVDELKLPAVCLIETGDEKLAKTVISTSKNRPEKIVTLHSLQVVADKEKNTYLHLMQENVKALKEALS